MRDFLKSSGRFVMAGWFWAFALLALPNCTQDFDQFVVCDPGNPDPECNPDDCDPSNPESPCFDPCLDPGNPECPAFIPGSTASDAIMCYIPAPLAAGDDGCALQSEADDIGNVSLTEAATALATSKSSSIALDWSATAACGGRPKKIAFLGGGPFPDGLTLCINCGTQIPAVYASADKACIAKCQDLINFGGGPIPAEGTDAYCEANAHVSPNYNNKETCDPRFAGACTGGGNPDLTFADPRRTPEPVVWIDHIGTDDNGGTNTLTRTAATAVPADFDAGAASAQTIISGDAWVEFAAGENDVSHVVGLRNSCADPVNDCPDGDPSIDAIGFAISLNFDNQVYVLETVPGPALNVLGPFGTYTPGERYRVKIVNNHDGTATISYVRIVGACPDGTVCTEDPLATSAATPVYPLRVDTAFREQNASVTNVTLVRIQQ